MRQTMIVLFALLAVTAVLGEAQPRLPFPQNTTYVAGSLAPDHISTAQLNDDVRAAYWRWKANYVAQAETEADSHPRYRVKAGLGADSATVSEGQGYGMLIAAVMAGEDPAAQTLFDGLWEFFNDHRSEIDSRLMDWHVPADESLEPGSDDSAFDGDCDIAFALLLAEQQWGTGGRVDYRAQFDALAAGILASTIGPDSRLPTLGDWVDAGGATYNQWTPRTSDFMPGHFRAFAAATGDPVWLQVVAASQAAVTSLQANHSPVTGLLPDFAVPASPADHTLQPAPPSFLEGPWDGDYYYNAGRCPWRIASDALLSGNPVSALQAQRISSWIRSATGGDTSLIKAGYELDGTGIGAYFSSFFAAPFAVAAMVDPGAQQWLDDLYDAVVSQEEGYFEDSVTLLSLLVLSRNFWSPERAPIFADGFESGSTLQWSAATSCRSAFCGSLANIRPNACW
jgi:hypothetical protein